MRRQPCEVRLRRSAAGDKRRAQGGSRDLALPSPSALLGAGGEIG